MCVVIPLQISVYLENGGLYKPVCIKFCFKLAKYAMETFATLQIALNKREEKSFYVVS
jgi:hypothetical protein